MQKPCQDSYYTLFSSYPTLLDYRENFPMAFTEPESYLENAALFK